MTPEIKKVYKKLSVHSNPKIAREASIQLWFESGANSDEVKEKSRINSMAKLSLLMILESRKNEQHFPMIVENTFLNSYDQLNKNKNK